MSLYLEIQKGFDGMNHTKLLKFLEERIHGTENNLVKNQCITNPYKHHLMLS